MNRRRSLVEPLEGRTLLALSATGGETLVNSTTAGDQFAPAVATDATGNYVVVWASDGQDGSGYGIFGQRYNSSGSALGSEFPINTITANHQSQPSVAMSPTGAFAVTWTSLSTSTGEDVYVRRFNAGGAALDPTEVQVNTFTAGDQESPHVAMDGNANFVVVWDSQNQDGSSYGVYARRFSSTGTPLSGEFLVNQYTTDLQADPTIAMDRAGDFVIAWNSGNLTTGQDGSFYGIFARRYNSAGVAVGNEFQVNTYTTDFQTLPVAAMDTDGDFVIAWQSYGQDGSQAGIYARRFNSGGVAQGDDFQVNVTFAGNQITPTIDMDARGDFTIAWNSVLTDGSFGGIFFQSFDYNGNFVGPQTRANTTTINDQSRPAIALNANGDAIIVWQSDVQDGDGYGIYSQRYTAPDQLAPTVVSASFNYLTNQSITITFSENVAPSLSLADMTLQSLTPTVTTIPNANLNLVYGGGNTATITFPGYPGGVLPDGNYKLTLNSAGITDTAGNQLDGDNNGASGGDYSLSFFVLAGDANRDRKVDATDLGILSLNWQAAGRNFAQGDFNYDTVVDLMDLYILAVRFNTSLPAPPPSAAPLSLTLAPARTPTRVATTVLR
jgi:hypothetical protein